MDANHLQASAARDQLWSSLKALVPDVRKLAAGEFDGSARQQQIVQLLAKIVVAELDFRREESSPAAL